MNKGAGSRVAEIVGNVFIALAVAGYFGLWAEKSQHPTEWAIMVSIGDTLVAVVGVATFVIARTLKLIEKRLDELERRLQ